MKLETKIPNEILDTMIRLDLTAREFKIILFLLRYINGFQLKQRVIKSKEFTEWTGLYRQHVHTALASLLEKGLIKRSKLEEGELGEYVYWINKDFRQALDRS